MNALRQIRAHGGQTAEAGTVAALPRLNAVFRGTTRTIRVWDGFGDAEEFTVDEARGICAEGDRALLCGFGDGRALLFLSASESPSSIQLARLWLMALLAAMRRALRVHDTAMTLAASAAGPDSS